MIENSSELREIAWGHVGPHGRSAIAAAHALRDVGIETAELSRKMFANSQKLILGAATNKDAKDACRTMSAFLNASYRDFDENAETISRIWRRYFREAAARAASARVTSALF
jgi:hypothetical protein